MFTTYKSPALCSNSKTKIQRLEKSILLAHSPADVPAVFKWTLFQNGLYFVIV